MIAARLGPFLLATLIAAVAAVCVLQFPNESGPTRWHIYLWRNDSRLVIAWAAALPLLWGISHFSIRRWLALGASVIGIALIVFLTAAAPAEVDRLFTFIQEPFSWDFVDAKKLYGLIQKPLFWMIVGVDVAALRFHRLLSRGAGLFLSAFAFGLSFAAATGWNTWITLGLPPNYHDEYAYLFQTWTYLSGRVSFPVDKLTPAFDQVHILTDGVFTSRYFPGTALWLAPFTAFGPPIVAMWAAHGLATGLYSLVAEKIHRGSGWLTALLVGTAPGMIVFSDAILATMPTMAAFGLFLWAWLGVHERPRLRTAILAGIAIGFAFITRPLTAVGLGFPFALYSFLRLWRPRQSEQRRSVLVMTAAFLAAASVLPAWSYLTLGTFMETPYSRYTTTRTPSHVYGFYNVERAAPLRSAETFHPYDSWATNLTLDLALPTLRTRVENALREGVAGVAFAALFLIASLATLHRRDDRTLLLWLSILGLALAYTPYWFVGVFSFGYFAEATPLLLVIIATTAAALGEVGDARKNALWGSAFTALVLLRALVNAGDVVPRNFEPTADGQFARREKKQVVDRENAALRAEGCNLLVLIDADPKTAVHSTLVNNHPGLEGPVVRAWAKSELIDDLNRRFSDRAVYLLEYKGFNQPFEWRRVRGPTKPGR